MEQLRQVGRSEGCGLPYNHAMRTAAAAAESCNKIDDVWRRLKAEYGEPRIEPTGDPIGQLVSTILSQHTADASSDRAYRQLRARFPTWSDVATAPLDEIAESIHLAGLSNQKATTIQTALRDLDSTDLQALSTLPVADARRRLTSIRGVGDKTASCVLLFALGMPAQPVDTHIERVSKRIGMTSGARTAAGIQDVLEECLPADGQTMYAFHVDLIRHGREICIARSPKCSLCVLSDLCAYYQQSISQMDS